MSTFINRTAPQMAANYYYRPAAAVPVPPRQIANVRDDYERWYTETSPNNRMSLSLRSRIHSEISWALERLCRLAYNEQFALSAYPGLIDGLFEWPEWYVTQGYKQIQPTGADLLFAPPREFVSQHRYALESLFIMRNAALNEQNSRELAGHSHTLPLICKALENLNYEKDQNQEVLLHIIDIFQVLAPNLVINASVPDSSNPIVPLKHIVALSKNRSLIISAFTALNSVLSNPSNASHLSRATDSLDAAIRYMPLFVDKPLLEVSLEHIYIHIAHPAAARAFLLNPKLRSVLKVLCTLVLTEQQNLEEKVTIDITGRMHSVSATNLASRDYELTKEELDTILEKAEPQRCYDWMRQMLVPKPEGEMTQVDIWTMYKDTFTPYQEKQPLLGASEVIKNIAMVYPTAQAMVLPGQVQRFVVRGIDRRKNTSENDRFKCQWDANACSAAPLASPSELAEHLFEHLSNVQPSANKYHCAWATCSQTADSPQRLRSHALTHIPSSQPPQRHPSQSETITLSGTDPYYAVNTPTARAIPPPPKTTIVYEKPTLDPPSYCLTALLITRILFRVAFADVEAAPKADDDHFGFPGVVEEDPDAPDHEVQETDVEGSRKGRKAFANIRNMLENIRIRDDALMNWVGEMLDAVSADI